MATRTADEETFLRFLQSLDDLENTSADTAKELKKLYDDSLTSLPPGYTTRDLVGFLAGRLHGSTIECFKDWDNMRKFHIADLCVKWVNPPPSALGSERDFDGVGIDFEVANLKLTHRYDLVALHQHAHHVLTSYYDNQNDSAEVEARYLAPYFAFIQSSGMGKTKLLYEMKQANEMGNTKANNESTLHGETKGSWRPIVKLILCRQPKDGRDEKRVFDGFLPNFLVEGQEFAVSYSSVCDFLNKQIGSDAANQIQDVVLLFDEAHYLTDTRNGMKGYLFRIIRLWLRFKRNQRVVAIFAGTKMKITNFTFEDDLNELAKTDTRNHVQMSRSEFHPSGKRQFNTFYTSTTTGCLRKQIPNISSDTDFERSVPFGRPLFAAMLQKKKLTRNMENILKRMLLLGSQVQGKEWSKEHSCTLNILATRVQMGQTTFDIASKLVGCAYANLVGLDGKWTRIHYPPDPVCARLAMCLMDEGWSFKLTDGRNISGMSKEEWTQQISILFSNRIFYVEKGDFGEVLVAFYFLLCADETRGRLDSEYKTFSVPLGEWISSLYKRSGHDEAVQDECEDDADPEDSLHDDATETASDAHPMEVDDDDLTSRQGKRPRDEKRAGSDSMDTCGETDPKEGTSIGLPHAEATEIYFSAIQVCRNYLRGYASSWKSLSDQDFLKNIFNAAVGFYVFGGCAMIDAVCSLALKTTTTTNDVVGYLPMFVSVKSHEDFTEGAAKKVCTALLKKAKGAKPKYGALCLLVIFGANRRGSDKEARLDDPTVMKQLLKGECIARVLRIHRNDRFGLSNVFASMTGARDEISEILASHGFVGYDDGKMIRAKSTEKPEEVYASQSLRKSCRTPRKPARTCDDEAIDEPLVMLSELASQLSFGNTNL